MDGSAALSYRKSLTKVPRALEGKHDDKRTKGPDKALGMDNRMNVRDNLGTDCRPGRVQSTHAHGDVSPSPPEDSEDGCKQAGALRARQRKQE